MDFKQKILRESKAMLKIDSQRYFEIVFTMKY